MRVSIFSTTFVRNSFYSKKNWARYDKECILVCMVSTPLSCPILIKLEFSERYSKILKYQISRKIFPVEAELFHVDRRTDGRTGGLTDMRSY